MKEDMMQPMQNRRFPCALLVALGLSTAGCKHDQDGEAAKAKAGPVDEQGLPEGPYADRDPALAKQLVDGGALLLDVRTPEEYASGHVAGAVNISHDEVAGRIGEIEGLVDGDKHKPVVIYCRSGGRAGMAKKDLTAAGFDRVTNLGGLEDWPD
jgi:rhodanese-related sulfurtransferase